MRLSAFCAPIAAASGSGITAADAAIAGGFGIECDVQPTADGEAPLSTFGRITTTITSARQIQLGIRALF